MVAAAACVGQTTTVVCVTGAGGFIASWLVQRLLSSGSYVVHGTVRDPSDPKHAHLMALDGAVERLRLFKADMLNHASVTAAVAGCDGVFHVASPIPASKPADPELEVVAPAVDGTRNVLRACHDANVRRVVVVSSVAAIAVNPKCPNGVVLDEEWWSDEDFCRTIKERAGWYFLSKTLAERAAFAYAKETGLDVVSVCPSWCLGPLLQPTVNNSSLTLIDYLKGDRDTVDDKMKNVVDVRDVAEALVRVYETPEASGRYICRSYPMSMTEILDIIKSFYPKLSYPKNFVKVQDERMFTSKKLQALGWSYRPAEETFKDAVKSYKDTGILNF